MTKKRIWILVLLGVFLVTLDEIIKFYISNNFSNLIGLCEGGKPFIHFHPTFNTAGSTIFLKLNLEYNRVVLMIIDLICLIVTIALWIYMYHEIIVYNLKKTHIMGVYFLLVASIARIIESFFWEYTLDYLSVKGVGVMDTIDLYLAIGVILIFATAFKIESIKKKKGKSKQQNKL